ncbi:sensor histidine kinase [Arachidicoccus sp.]|uniref:sensor histidine kinase n=1 Tax=Arachidicoccus sp. TaxID=1872624 RepID=UPI003D1D4030
MKYIIFFLSLIFFVHLHSIADAQFIHFTPNIANNYIGKSVSVFLDSSNKIGLEGVRQHPELFHMQSDDVPNLGMNNDNFWIKFSIVNESHFNKIILNLEYPNIDKVTLYRLENSLQADSITIKEGSPISQRIYKHQYYIFDLNLPPGDSVTCFLLIRSSKRLLLPLTLNTERSIISSITMSDIFSGMYFGLMLAMLLYNLFIYFSVKDRHYLSYVHYIFWVTITQATLFGYSQRFIWSSNKWLLEHMLILTAAMSGIATIIFTKSFLYVKKNFRYLDWALNVIILGDLTGFVMVICNYKLVAYSTINITAGIGALIVLTVAIIMAYYKKYKPAKYFLIAWTVFLISIIIFVLKDFGLINYNFWTVHSIQIGSAAETMLLSFALAAKINILKKEKEASQEEALRVSKENARIIREQNASLEIKVAERTSELNNALEDLKQAETQLVESEKMVTLGQLTAGIAHEVNNPINFVTSNVSPLKRDIDILFNAIDYIEQIALSDKSKEEKIAEIQQYSEEQDLTYLRTEVEHLIKGIHNGASRTAEIVRGLRLFSRLDEDSLKHASLQEGIDSAMIILSSQVGSIKIVRDYGELPSIECYPGKLNQVFLNILSNAIFAVNKQFDKKPGGEIRIITRLELKTVVIIFEDNGIGMDEDTQNKVFNPFFTTKDVGEGTGLGMSISHTIIKKHNGSIQIESSPGNGAKFTITLPIYQDPSIDQ